MLQLNNLTKLTQKRKRVGRGGSRGGTSGKGSKGQKARSGGTRSARFEGGQMPLSRRLPKRGFSNHIFKQEFSLITLEQLNNLFQDGQTVTKAMLLSAGCTKKGMLVKVLANGTLEKNITIEVDACSKTAQAAIESRGGAVKLV